MRRGAILPKESVEKETASASTGAATRNTGLVASGCHAKVDCRIPIRIIAKKDGGGAIPPKKPGEKPSASAPTGAATHNTGSVASGSHAKADCRIPILIIAKKDGGGAIPPKKPDEKPSASASTGGATQNTGSVASGSHAKSDCRISIRMIAKKDGGGAILPKRPDEKPSASASTGAATQKTGSVASGSHAKADYRSSIRILTKKDVGGAISPKKSNKKAISPKKSIKKAITSASSESATQSTSSASSSHAKSDCRIPIQIPAKKDGRGAIPPKKPGEKATTSAPTRAATQNTGSVATGCHAKVDCRSSIRIFTKKDVGGAISPKKSIKKAITSASSESATQNTSSATGSLAKADCRIPIRIPAKKDGRGAIPPKKPGEKATASAPTRAATQNTGSVATCSHAKVDCRSSIRIFTKKDVGGAISPKKSIKKAIASASSGASTQNTSSDTGGVSSSVPPRKSATKAMVTTNRETPSGGRNADTDNYNQSVSLKTNGNIPYV